MELLPHQIVAATIRRKKRFLLLTMKCKILHVSWQDFEKILHFAVISSCISYQLLLRDPHFSKVFVLFCSCEIFAGFHSSLTNWWRWSEDFQLRNVKICLYFLIGDSPLFSLCVFISAIARGSRVRSGVWGLQKRALVPYIVYNLK